MLRRIYTSLLLSLFLWPITAISSSAQPPAQALPSASQDGKTPGPQIIRQPNTQEADQGYRLGPGDLVSVRVFGRAELSGETRLDNNGRITLPFIKELPVACLTEAQLAAAITEKYKKYLRDPQVDVLIKEYRSQPVAVIGAVTQPGRFQLQRRVRLLELVTFAGGPSNRAGTSIHVIHSVDHGYCTGGAKEQASLEASPQAAEQAAQHDDVAGGVVTDPLLQLSSIKLKDLLSGNQSANPYIQPGDIISIPEAEQFFVTGAVTKPGAYPLNSKIMLTEAVALAGGVNMDGAKNRIRLVRPIPGTDQRKETVYNIDDIQRRKVEDIALQPNDIIEVPGSTTRIASRNLLGVGINMLSALPFFVLR